MSNIRNQNEGFGSLNLFLESSSKNDDHTQTKEMTEFTTECAKEKKFITWKIKDFNKLHRMKSAKEGKTSLTITAGESLGQPSIFSLDLNFLSAYEIDVKLLWKSGKRVNAIYHVIFPSSDKFSAAATRHSAITEFKGSYYWDLSKPLTLEDLKSIGALDDDDTLTLEVSIVTYGDEIVSQRNQQGRGIEILKQNARDLMSTNFPLFLKDGECSDLVIRVKKMNSQEYVERKVHRVILSAQSPVFKTMLGSPMSEKETGIVTIEDLTPEGLDVLLEFLYTGNLPDTWKTVPEEIVNAAEKYDLPLLKAYFDEWLHTACTPDNAASLRNLAKSLGLSKASNDILTYIKSNLEDVLDSI